MSLNEALSAGNLTVMRGTAHAAKWYLAIAPQTSFATARINQAVFSVPLTQITVDTVSADWTSAKPDMTVWIGTTAGASDVGIYRVRATPGATTLYISELASGDPGLVASRVTNPLADNQYITIINDYNLHSVFPKIEYSGGVGTFRKNSTVTYTTQTKTGGAVPGIVNFGEHVITQIEDGATYIDERGVDVIVFSGAVSTYAWRKDAAGTLVDGALDSAQADIEYPPGHYIVSVDVTLNNGAVMTADRHIWVFDKTTYPPIEVQVMSRTSNRKGASFTCEILGTFPSDLLKGAMVMLWEKTDSTAITSATTKAVGFVESIDGAIRPGIGTATISVISPLEVMNRIRGFSQILKAVTGAPADWNEASTGLMTVDFFCFYILYWHSTLLRLFDFNTSGLNYSKYIWKAETGTWLAAINSATELIDCELTQDSHGNLWIKRDPSMMSSAARSSVVNRGTFGEDDFAVESDGQVAFGYQRMVRAACAKVEVYALSTHTTSVDDVVAYASLAMGGSGGQGTGEMTLNRLTSNGQTETNALAGYAFAKANNSFARIGFDLQSGYLLIEPAMRYFITLNITTAALLPTGESLSFRVIPQEVTVNYQVDDRGGITQRVSVTAEAEADGTATPGATLPIPARTGYDYSLPAMGTDGLFQWSFDPFDFPTYYGLPPIAGIIADTSTALAGTPGTASLAGIIFAWATDLGYLSDIPSKTWTELYAPGGSSQVMDFCHSDQSPFILSTGSVVKAWVLVWNGTTTSTLRYSADIIGTATSLMQTFADSKYLAMRHVSGVVGGLGIMAAGKRTDAWSHTFDFTASDHGWQARSDASGIWAVWTTAVGWEDNAPANLGGAQYIHFYLLFNTPVTLTEVSFDLTATFGGGSEDIAVFKITAANVTPATVASNITVLKDNFAIASGTQTWTGSSANAYGVFIAVNLDTSAPYTGTGIIDSCTIEGTGDDPVEGARYFFSSDGGTTAHASNVVVGGYRGDSGFDCDDYNLGVTLYAAGNTIYRGYDGAGDYTYASFTALSGASLTGVDGRYQVTFIRIPYLKQNGAANNVVTAMEFVYGTNGGYVGLVVFNATTGAIASDTDRSISISGTTYYVPTIAQKDNNGNAFTVYGGDARAMYALVLPLGGSTSSETQVYTTNGGTSWAIGMTTLTGIGGIYPLEPDMGGDGAKVWFGGGSAGNDIVYSTNRGATIIEYEGNFSSAVSNTGIKGVYQIAPT